MNFEKCVKVTVYARDTIDPTFQSDVTMWLSPLDLISMEQVYDGVVEEKRLFVPCTLDQQMPDVETFALEVESDVGDEIIITMTDTLALDVDQDVLGQLRFTRSRFKSLLNHANGELGKSGRVE